MRYSLRTLMIVLAALPPTIGGIWAAFHLAGEGAGWPAASGVVVFAGYVFFTLMSNAHERVPPDEPPRAGG